MKNVKVSSRGGNQYEVTIGDEIRVIDLDGYTIITDDDRALMEAAGLDVDNMDHGTMVSPDMGIDDGDEFFAAAVDHCANYSGFNARARIDLALANE